MTLSDWYQKDLMRALVEELKKAGQEEGEASLKYLSKVDELEKLGLLDAAKVVREIAGDESKHQHQLAFVVHELEDHVALLQ